MASAPRVKLIANPVAGRDAEKRIDRAATWLRGRGVLLDLTLTAARGDARRAAAAARQENFARIIAAGGDGTLNEVVNGLAPSPVPLAFLPLGTTNVFALETGLPTEVEAACRIALDGQAVPVCLGGIDDSRFLLMASAGLDAEAVYRGSPCLKRLAGKGAYLASALGALLRRPPRAIEVRREDAGSIRCYGAIVSNGRLYGGRFVVAPEASLQEPRLDVCLLLRPGRLGVLRLAAALAGGRTPAPGLVRRFKARQLDLAGADVPIQIDGDHFGRLPARLTVKSGELQMMLPWGGRE